METLSEQGGWINSPPLDIEALLKEKKVVLIDFWTYTCLNCIRATPYTEELWKRYKDYGLVVIGVHSPEFQVERNPENIQEAVERAGITYPVVTDADRKIWDAFQNRYWPAKYVINPEGKIVYTQFGEGKYKEEEEAIVAQLKEAGWNPPEYGEPTKFREPSGKRVTPELYAGPALLRQPFGNKEQPAVGETVTFTMPEKVKPGQIYLEGKWLGFFDYVQSVTDGEVVLKYQASAPYVVLGPPKKGDVVEVEVLLDGKPVKGPDTTFRDGKSYLVVDKTRLYSPVADSTPYGEYTLTLRAPPGLRLYSFTFGAYAQD